MRDARAGSVFNAGGRAARLLRAHDWSSTALGPVEQWPESLKAALRLMLSTPAPAFVWWGPELLSLHNDACARLFGNRRAGARSIGRPASEVRREIWAALGADVLEVMAERRPASISERQLFVRRDGRDEARWCSVTLTPIGDEDDEADGVLGVCVDETERVLARRRQAALRALDGSGCGESVDAAARRAAAALAGDADDLPFVLIYAADGDGHAHLAGAAGTVPEPPPATLPLEAADGEWPVPTDGEPVLAESLPHIFGRETERRVRAAMIRLPGGAGPAGVLLAGVDDRLPFDDDFRGFLTAAASVIGAAITTAASAADGEHGAPADSQTRRNEFLAMLAHELRNPLAPIRSAAEMLSYVDRNPMSIAQAREIIERQVAQLVRLVDDLLDANRISSGRIQLQRASLDLRTAAAAAVESVQPLIDDARHELSVHMPEHPVAVNGDHARLCQAIANLLTNAAQYTDGGGHIVLTIEHADGCARIRVADDGIGLDEAMVGRIFEMFTQGEQPGGAPGRGLGIGLAISRRLIELHGGGVSASSPGKGCGSEFVISLPLETGDPAVADGTGAVPRCDARRILVADDNGDAASAMAEVLGMAGHQVRIAGDGLEAVETAEAFRPELILLDLGMPRLDGYEVCRRIREQPWGRELPIYAVTGWGQASDRRRTREAGFNAHLVKPVAIGTIEALIAGCDR